MSVRVRGIVVGGTDFGEAHRVVRLLCAERGRVSLLARSARAATRRFAGLLELGTELEVEERKGRGDLAVFGEAERLGGPRRARKELERIALLAYGCELCAALAAEEAPAERLHGLLRVWLELLEGEALPGAASRVALEAKALTFAGVAPQLRRCVHCGLAIDDPAVFDPRSGGACHARCGGGRPVTLAQLEQLEALRRTPLAETVGWAAPEAPWLLADGAEVIAGRAIRARALVEELRT